MKRNLLIVLTSIICLSANAQNVLTVTADTKAITTDKSGSYDRITEEWSLESGKAYLLMMPAKLDGYYFGPDAKRQMVTSCEKQSSGTYVVRVIDMNDLTDFDANTTYLITPTVNCDNIIHVASGIKIEAQTTPDGKELLHTTNVEATTGINNIFMDGDHNKPAAIYDLQGRQVKTIQKGATYIINGKKTIIK